MEVPLGDRAPFSKGDTAACVARNASIYSRDPEPMAKELHALTRSLSRNGNPVKKSTFISAMDC